MSQYSSYQCLSSPGMSRSPLMVDGRLRTEAKIAKTLNGKCLGDTTHQIRDEPIFRGDKVSSLAFDDESSSGSDSTNEKVSYYEKLYNNPRSSKIPEANGQSHLEVLQNLSSNEIPKVDYQSKNYQFENHHDFQNLIRAGKKKKRKKKGHSSSESQISEKRRRKKKKKSRKFSEYRDYDSNSDFEEIEHRMPTSAFSRATTSHPRMSEDSMMEIINRVSGAYLAAKSENQHLLKAVESLRAQNTELTKLLSKFKKMLKQKERKNREISMKDTDDDDDDDDGKIMKLPTSDQVQIHPENLQTAKLVTKQTEDEPVVTEQTDKCISANEKMSLGESSISSGNTLEEPEISNPKSFAKVSPTIETLLVKEKSNKEKDENSTEGGKTSIIDKENVETNFNPYSPSPTEILSFIEEKSCQSKNWTNNCDSVTNLPNSSSTIKLSGCHEPSKNFTPVPSDVPTNAKHCGSLNGIGIKTKPTANHSKEDHWQANHFLVTTEVKESNKEDNKTKGYPTIRTKVLFPSAIEELYGSISKSENSMLISKQNSISMPPVEENVKNSAAGESKIIFTATDNEEKSCKNEGRGKDLAIDFEPKPKDSRTFYNETLSRTPSPSCGNDGTRRNGEKRKGKYLKISSEPKSKTSRSLSNDVPSRTPSPCDDQTERNGRQRKGQDFKMKKSKKIRSFSKETISRSPSPREKEEQRNSIEKVEEDLKIEKFKKIRSFSKEIISRSPSPRDQEGKGNRLKKIGHELKQTVNETKSKNSRSFSKEIVSRSPSPSDKHGKRNKNQRTREKSNDSGYQKNDFKYQANSRREPNGRYNKKKGFKGRGRFRQKNRPDYKGTTFYYSETDNPHYIYGKKRDYKRASYKSEDDSNEDEKKYYNCSKGERDGDKSSQEKELSSKRGSSFLPKKDLRNSNEGRRSKSHQNFDQVKTSPKQKRFSLDTNSQEDDNAQNDNICLEEWSSKNFAGMDRATMASLKEKVKLREDEISEVQPPLKNLPTEPACENTTISVETLQPDVEFVQTPRNSVVIEWGNNASRNKTSTEKSLVSAKSQEVMVGKIRRKLVRDGPILAQAKEIPKPLAKPVTIESQKPTTTTTSLPVNLPELIPVPKPMVSEKLPESPAGLNLKEVLEAAQHHIKMKSLRNFIESKPAMEIPLPPLPAAQDKDPQALMDTRSPVDAPLTNPSRSEMEVMMELHQTQVTDYSTYQPTIQPLAQVDVYHQYSTGYESYYSGAETGQYLGWGQNYQSDYCNTEDGYYAAETEDQQVDPEYPEDPDPPIEEDDPTELEMLGIDPGDLSDFGS